MFIQDLLRSPSPLSLQVCVRRISLFLPFECGIILLDLLILPHKYLEIFFKVLILFYYFQYMSVLPACLCTIMCWCLLNPEWDIRPPGTGVSDTCEPQCGGAENKTLVFWRSWVLLTAEASLQTWILHICHSACFSYGYLFWNLILIITNLMCCHTYLSSCLFQQLYF